VGLADLFSNLSSIGSSTAVGLSIGTSSIKVVELKKTRKQWNLLHFGFIQLPEDALINREVSNQIAVIESIKTLVNQVNLKSKNVCTSLSGTSIIIKRMTVEAPNKRELQEQVFWEAEQYLPFDVSEVVMDFHLIDYSKEKQADVLLVAVKKASLDSYMECVSGAGLKTKTVDVDFFALHNLFELNYSSGGTEAVALVDIGASSLKLVVSAGGVPVFTKDSAIGGKNLTTEIQKHLNLSFADAETLKIGGQGNQMPQDVMDLMSIMSENFAGEIKRALDFYNASSSGAPVTTILLTGGSCKIPQLPQVISEQVGLPVQILNPFNSISYDPAVFTEDYIAAIGPLAAVPVGLAMRMG